METYKDYLVFSPDYKTKIAFLSTEHPKSSFTVSIDWDFPLNHEKPKMFLENSSEEEKQNVEKEEKFIHNIAVCENSDLLAYTSNEKSVFISKIEGSSCKTLSRRIFLRTTSCIRFSGSKLYLADKTGDVFEYLCDDENLNKPARWIFGHISQILDLKVSPNLNYILTSDRDEKIRITNAPNYHEIESYCLGHKEFVSSLIVLSDRLLMSLSGDNTLRLWNYLTGKQLDMHEFSFTPILFRHHPQSACEGIICISTSDSAVKMYKYQLNDESSLKLDSLHEKKYENDVEIAECRGKFYVQYVSDAGKLCIDGVDISEKSSGFRTLHDSCELNELLNLTENVNLKIFKSFDVKILFKNGGKYDNVKDYIDRKKARIESQGLKKK